LRWQQVEADGLTLPGKRGRELEARKPCCIDICLWFAGFQGDCRWVQFL
jgi:hypothetical protein